MEKEKRPLRDIVNHDGLEKFLEIQQSTLMSLNVDNHVISTGGSVVYNEAAMEHLKRNSIVVYLKLEFDEIKKRLSSGRRLARDSNKSFEDVTKSGCLCMKSTPTLQSTVLLKMFSQLLRKLKCL